MTTRSLERLSSGALDDALASGIAALGLDIPPAARAKLLALVALLAKWNGVYNLTAIREPERMVTHHLLDSLAALPTLDALVAGRSEVRVLDVGSGAGLPGLPIAIVRPAWQVVMREPVQKKVAFMTQAIAELAIANAQASLGRVEDLHSQPGFAIVISRAFADLASFVHSSLAQVGEGGSLVAMKGVHPDEELRELPDTVVVERTVALRVPGVDGARHLIVMRRR